MLDLVERWVSEPLQRFADPGKRAICTEICRETCAPPRLSGVYLGVGLDVDSGDSASKLQVVVSSTPVHAVDPR